MQIQEKIAKKRYELVGEKYFEKWEKEIEHKASRKRQFRDLRNFFLSHYGGGKMKCVCCGEKQLLFLTLDHVNNDGYCDEIKKKNSGVKYYKYLIKHNFPSVLQTLCWNCNCGKARNGGVCPHKLRMIQN